MRPGFAVSSEECRHHRLAVNRGKSDLIDPIMYGNARHIFDLAAGKQRLERAPWV